MKAILLIFFCLLAVLVVPVHASDSLTAKIVVSAPTPDTVTLNVSEFRSLLRGAIAERNWTKALSISEEAAAANPDNADFVCNGGYSLRKLGRYEEAVKEVSEGCVLDPKPVRFANRGYAYLAMGNNTAALADAETGIAMNASYPTSYAVKALALRGLGENNEALTAIDHAVGLDPENAHYWHVRGNLLADSGDCEGARVSLERSIALDSNYDLPWPGFANATADLATMQSTCNPSVNRNRAEAIANGTGSAGAIPTKSPSGPVAVFGLAIALVVLCAKR